LTMLVFTLFFGRLEVFQSDAIPYPLFAFCGLVLWSYFAGLVNQAGQSLAANSNLITKVYFPRLALPISSAVAGLIDFIVGLAVLLLMMVYYEVRPSWALLWVPIFVATLILLALGTGMLLAAMTVRYRDIKYTLPFLIQLWFYTTPVIYPITLIPERF